MTMICSPSCLFWYLYLAHLLADYPLQTDEMVQAKRTWWGRVLHVGVHLAVLLFVVGRARRVLWPYLLALAAIHYGFDSLKTGLGQYSPQWVSVPYLLDQLAHLLAILVIAAWIGVTTPASMLPPDHWWPIYAAGYLLATYAWFVTERVLAHAHETYHREIVAQLWPRMAVRAGLLTGFLLLMRLDSSGIWSTLPLVGLTLSFPYLTGTYGRQTLVTDIGVASLVALLILWAS